MRPFCFIFIDVYLKQSNNGCQGISLIRNDYGRLPQWQEKKANIAVTAAGRGWTGATGVVYRGRGWAYPIQQGDQESFTPMASATVWISLSPRPERQTTMVWSFDRVGASFSKWAMAWDDSRAGRIPSSRVNS